MPLGSDPINSDPINSQPPVAHEDARSGLTSLVTKVYDAESAIGRSDCKYLFVNAAKDYYGTDQFYWFRDDVTNADKIIDWLKSDYSGAVEITDMKQVQNYSNDGRMLVGAMTSQELGDSHGHINIVLPGSAQWSGNWNDWAPNGANRGSSDFLSMSLNHGFVPKPHFYLLPEPTFK